MKNVEFANDEIKKAYKSIINEHPGVSKIILNLIQEKRGIKVEKIINGYYGTQLVITKDDEIYMIDIDFLKKKVYLTTPKEPYKTIYSDLARKYIVPEGYLYQNDKRIIIEHFLLKMNTDKNNVRHFEIEENGKHYTLVFESINKAIDEDAFINNILNNNTKYDTIRDLFLTITGIVNLSDINIKLSDAKGSNIIIEDGEIKKYIEYQEKNNQYEKIFLENNEFFIEKKVRGEYRDELTSYIKKLGGRNGKEKR